jgi:hypothetical protein
MSFGDRFRAFLEEKSYADFFTLEFPPSSSSNSSSSSSSNSNSSSSSNSNKSSNSSSSSSSSNSDSDDSVFDPDKLNSQWSLASDAFKGDLVNHYLAKEIAKQAGLARDKPVEIIVKFDNNQHASLFAIKHKREKGAKSAAKGRKNIDANDDIDFVAAEDNDFINFSRRISHELLIRIVKTQGSKEADVKRSIANLAHQVHTLNPEACLEGLVSANAANILRPLDVHETHALISLLQLSYRKLEILRRFVRSLQPNNTSLFASRIKVAQLVRKQQVMLHFDKAVINTQYGEAGDFSEVVTKYSYAIMIDIVNFYLSAMSERDLKEPPGISFNGRRPCIPMTVMGDAGGGTMSYLLLVHLLENEKSEHGLSLGEFMGKEHPELLKKTQLPHIEDGINDLNNVVVVFIQSESKGDEMQEGSSENAKSTFRFAYTLIPKSVYEQYFRLNSSSSSSSSASGGGSSNTGDDDLFFSHDNLPQWISFECDEVDNCSISFNTKKRGIGMSSSSTGSATVSDKFHFNRPFHQKTFIIRFLAFELFLTGDLAFLMTLLGQHNLSHVRCPLCNLKNSDKANPKLAWQDKESKGALWTIESLARAKKDVLLKGIAIDHVVLPVLHLTTGIWNYILNVLLIYIRNKIEKDLPDVAEKKLRLIELNSQLSSKKLELDNKESQLKSMPSSNLSMEQQLLFAMLTNLIPALKIEIKDLKRKEKEMSKAIAKLKLDRKNRPIEQKLEHILHEHNISFKPWMDIFSLSGDNCRRLAERHVNIFKEVQEVILANVPSASSVNQAALDTFNNSVDLLFHKLSLLASLFDTISVVMNDITAQNAQSIEEFEIMCHLFGSLWRKCNLNVTPKVHMMEHLPMIMQMYGRIGLFNENPIERVYILNNRWNKTLESLKSWEHLVQLKFQRENVCKTKPVYDALSKFAQFQMRKSNQTKKGSGHSHVSFAEIIKLIGDFDKNQDDLDDQLKDLISPETQVYDMEGGMEEVDLGVGVVAVGDT